MALTFLIVLVAWVFFRADTLPDAWRYLQCMFGGAVPGQGEAVRGLIYSPYHVANFAVAALVVWTFPQTWDFTRRLGWAKIAWCILAFFLALAALTTQSYNPFIYFIF